MTATLNAPDETQAASTCLWIGCDQATGPASRKVCRAHYDQLWRAGRHHLLATAVAVCGCGTPLVAKKTVEVPEGARRHRGHGLCPPCYYAQVVKPRQGLDRHTYSAEEIMNEWDWCRGWVPFEEFGAKLGITQTGWEAAFRRAQKAGDPRARRAHNDPKAYPDPLEGLRPSRVRDRRHRYRKAS